MKSTKIIYWTSTVLFAGFMAFTAIPDILVVEDAVTFITGLGYPEYFVPFIGVAKLLGCMAIVVPGFPRVKEWAYAGLFYDLIGAVYSALMSYGFDLPMLTMLPVFAVGIVSLVYSRKMYGPKKELSRREASAVLA